MNNRHDPPSLTQSVAPKPRLAAELKRVASSVEHLIAEVAKTNIDPVQFPRERLIGIAQSIIDLAAGSEEGALFALEYAESSLSDLRYSFIEIAEDDRLPDVARDGRVDQSLSRLISDVGTAKRFYSQARLDAAAKSEAQEQAVGAPDLRRRTLAERMASLSLIGRQIALELDKGATRLAARDADRLTVDNLARNSRDVANLVRQEGIEIGVDMPRIAWLDKLDRAVAVALRAVELGAGIAKIAIEKIDRALTKSVTEWLDAVSDGASEARSLVTDLKRRWQKETYAPESDQRAEPFGRNSSIFSNASRRGALPSRYFRDFAGAPTMIVVPAGEFVRGSPESDENAHASERPQRKMTILEPFAVSVSPVTRGEFAVFVEATNYVFDIGAYIWSGSDWVNDAAKSWRDPGFVQTDDHPVVCVNWNDARAYVEWLRVQSGGKGYRLLSEAEWEYCCRAGTSSAFSTGGTITAGQANFGENAKGTTAVGSFPPNPWGLYDMHGNVWEWCEDNWHPNYRGAPENASAWRGASSRRILRGGGWNESPYSLRSAGRYWDRPDGRSSDVGFRIARAL